MKANEAPEQYIPKSVLVAKIKEYMKTYNKGYADGDDRRADALEVLLHNIDTLEVKEVDLDTDFGICWGNYIDCGGNINNYEVAKHFYELGLKTQYSSIDIHNIDDLFEEEGINPNSKDAKVFKECYYMALERFKEENGEKV